MKELIARLKQQHWEIRSSCEALDKFSKNGLHRGADLEKWMAEKSSIIFHINNFKKILLPHLKLEDNELYPVLLKSKNKEIREVSLKYSDEIMLISKRTVSFFDTYAHLKADDLFQNEYFKLDLNTIITIIRKRIDIEEVELYPLYDKL